MMTASEQAALASRLRADGATVIELAAVMQAVDEIDQVIELARAPSWKNERRDTHGKWTSGGGGMAPVARGARNLTAAQDTAASRKLASAQRTTRMRAEAARSPSAVRLESAPLTSNIPTPEHIEISKMIDEVRGAHQKLITAKAAESAGENSKHAKRAAAAVAAIAGGTILAAVEHHFGVPDIFQVLSEIGPLILDALFDWWKKL